MVVSIGWFQIFQIITEKMVGNHQTSIKNGLFRVPGMFYLTGVQRVKVPGLHTSREPSWLRDQKSHAPADPTVRWPGGVARGAYKQQKNEEITWMKYAYTELYTRPKVGPLVPERRNSRATNLIEKKPTRLSINNYIRPHFWWFWCLHVFVIFFNVRQVWKSV